MLKLRDKVLKVIYEEATIACSDIKIEEYTAVEIHKQVQYMIANCIVKADKNNKLGVTKSGLQEYIRIDNGRILRRTMITKQNVKDLFTEELEPITITELNTLFMGNIFISPSIYKTRKWVKELYTAGKLYLHHKVGNMEYFISTESKYLTPDIVKKSLELKKVIEEDSNTTNNIRHFFNITKERCKAYEC